MPDWIYALLGAGGCLIVGLILAYAWVLCRIAAISDCYRVHFPDGTTDREDKENG